MVGSPAGPVVQHALEGALDPERLPATVYVFRIEADGTASFPYVSQACAELYGFTQQEAMARVDLMHDAVHTADRRRFDRAGQQSLRTLEPVRWEGRIVRPDGGERAVLITSRPTRGSDGSTEWLGVVTERPAAGADLDDDASGAQGDVLAMLAHDLANPLTAIVASAEWALEDLARADLDVAATAARSAMERRLQSIVRQARRISDLRDDVLAVVASDADVLQPEGVTVDVLPYLRAAADLDGLSVNLFVDCPTDVYCVVQPSHLSQMLTNLVSNAVRYARREVTLSATQAGPRILITVRDDGPGVPPGVAPRLFRRFSHAGVPARPAGAGSGLGLYIVRTLAAANGGTVVYTPSESGARFTLALPAANPPTSLA